MLVMTRSKIPWSQKFHQYFQIFINFQIQREFFIDTIIFTFEMHNFALKYKFPEVSCLKSIKFTEIVFFSFFCALTLSNKKNWLKYISSALLRLFYRSYFSFIMDCDANIHIKTDCLLKMIVFHSKKMFFYKEFSL